MPHPFRRSLPAHRAPSRPAPGTHAFELDSEPCLEVTEGNDDSDWALWEDSVQSFESSGILPIDPFDKVGKNDG